ncbi:MAG: LysM peptidoglycan-binding domain-containing protein [Caenibius sp.]
MKHLALPLLAVLLIAASPTEETEHVVREGETLGGIANRAGVSASAIARANSLAEPYVVRIGQKLKIPRAGSAAKKASASRIHEVKEGETLNGIAIRAGVAAADLARANGLSEPYVVRIGQKLKIPGKGSPPPQARAATPASQGRAQQGFHVVEPGETLGGIANRAGVKASALAAANGLKEPYIVRIGQKLKLPDGATQPPAAPDPDPRDGETYIVKEGETLGGIANRAAVPRIMIIEANGLNEPYAVRAGQKLIIPRQHRHTVAEGETGFSIAYKYGVPYADIAVANNLADGQALKPGQMLVIPAILTKDAQPGGGQGPVVLASDRFIWPLEGAILTPFNSADASRGHNGIDIAASIGAPVKAAKEGKIIFAGDEPVRYGKMIIIAHAGGWHSAYGHLSSITARKGARVGAGEVIGHAGSTGDAQEPELHFELRKSNRPVDPVKQLTPPAP